MFEGFRCLMLDTGQIRIKAVTAGGGAPVLLLHGYPQCLAMWSGVAPVLANNFTVVCTDLRGYGDSDKPACASDYSTYSFRAMAADQVEAMRKLGHERFHVVGHDRGGRVAHRMALDWPDRVLSVTLLDIIPTYDMYLHTDRQFATTFWLWFFLPLPEPFPERLIGADPDFFFESCLGRYGGTGLREFDAAALDEYRRCWRQPAMIHASCADYRSGASIDLEHDRIDLHERIRCPTLVLWAADGLMAKQFDFRRSWAARCHELHTGTIPGGHFFPDQKPRQTAEALSKFLSAVAAHAAVRED
jgi:haloacetate dehalogenase